MATDTGVHCQVAAILTIAVLSRIPPPTPRAVPSEQHIIEHAISLYKTIYERLEGMFEEEHY